MLCPQPPWPEAVCIEFRRKIDDAIRAEHGGMLPWQRHVAIGDIDFFQMHSLLLDLGDELVVRLLPIGRRHFGATWRGRRTAEAPEILVDLMTGRWWAPARKGRDLIGLIAYVLDERPHRVVKRMQVQLGVTVVRHV